MAETPEVPEADDLFSKRVAITIAALAVIISIIGNKGDNAKTEAIIKTTEAANKWAYFQSKSIKETEYETTAELLKVLPEAGIDAAKRTALAEKCAKKIAKYEAEKTAIGPGVFDSKTNKFIPQFEQKDGKDDPEKPIVSAAELDHEAKHLSQINDRTDEASLLLQIGVIMCSVAILTKSHRFWFVGMGLGLAGAGYGATAFFM